MPDEPSEEPRHIVLVGSMGAGKTSVGRILAQRLGRPLRDSDEWILEQTGRTVRRLRREIGVDGMHRFEAGHLRRALSESTPSIVAAAASIVDDPECRAALAQPGIATVWLRARPETLARRFDSSAHRPAFGEDPDRFLAAQAAARYPELEAISQVVVDVDDANPAETAEAVLTKLGLS